MTDQVTETIFTDTSGNAPVAPATPVVTQPDPTPATFSIPDMVTEFVGEGKKYASAEDALSSIPHAQSHIDRLEEEAKTRDEELAILREQVAKSTALDDVLDSIKSNQDNSGIPPRNELDETKVTSLVNSVLQSNEAQKAAQVNVDSVINKGLEVFGDKADEVFHKAAQDNGLTVDQLNKLSATAPQAVMKLMGIGDKISPIPTKSEGSVNTDTFNTNQPEPNTSSNIMSKVGLTTKDMVEGWRKAKP